MTSQDFQRPPEGALVLTSKFELPDLQSDPDAPEVDHELLIAFANNTLSQDRDQLKVLSHLNRYAQWRAAFKDIIADLAANDAKEDFSPEPPSQ